MSFWASLKYRRDRCSDDPEVVNKGNFKQIAVVFEVEGFYYDNAGIF